MDYVLYILCFIQLIAIIYLYLTKMDTFEINTFFDTKFQQYITTIQTNLTSQINQEFNESKNKFTLFLSSIF